MSLDEIHALAHRMPQKAKDAAGVASDLAAKNPEARTPMLRLAARTAAVELSLICSGGLSVLERIRRPSELA